MSRYDNFEKIENEIENRYRKLYEDKELQNIVVFRSGPHELDYLPGMDFTDNARAIFDYMIANKYNEKYELVWVVKNPDEFKEYEKIHNVSFVAFEWARSDDTRKTDAYYRVICLAKYFFFTDAYGFVRNCRKDQIRIQLWHGCGFKTRVFFSPCEKKYEFNIVIGELYKKIHRDIYGLRDDQVVITGYPKADYLFHAYDGWQQLFHVPKADKYIFWLPTFRSTKQQDLNQYALQGEVGLPGIHSMTEYVQMNELLKRYNMVMVIKLHPFQSTDDVYVENMSNILFIENSAMVKADLQINQILGVADALISDYSSAAVDYLILDRPIAFVIEDIDEYKNSRGFVFDNIEEMLPGAEITSFSGFMKFIEEQGKNIDCTREKRKKIRDIMHQYKDDGSCKRVLDMFGII